MVAGENAPLVVRHVYAPVSHRNHRLNGDGHACHKPYAPPRFPVVGYARILVHFPADSVTRQVADNAVAVCLGVLLNRPANIAQSIAGPGLLGTQPEAFLRDLHKLHHFVGSLAYGGGECTVRLPAVQDQSAVYAEELSFPQGFIAGKAMNNLFIHACADGEREAFESFEGRRRARRADHPLRFAVDFEGRHAGLDHRFQMLKHLMEKLSSIAHFLNLRRIFGVNHFSLRGRPESPRIPFPGSDRRLPFEARLCRDSNQSAVRSACGTRPDDYGS